MTFQLRTEHIPVKKNQKTKLKKFTLFCCSYNPNESMITYQLQEIGKGLEFYTSNYEKILLMGYFNCEMSEALMNSFCNLYNLKCLVQEPTCYKNP